MLSSLPGVFPMKRFYIPILLLAALSLSRCSKNNDNVSPKNQVDFDIQQNFADTSLRINDIIQLADSSFIMTGGASMNGGNFQNLIMKYDKNGKKVWVSIKSLSDSPKGFSRAFALSQSKYSAYRDVGFSYDPAPRIVDYNSSGTLLSQNFVNTSISMFGLAYESGNYYLAGVKNNYMAFQELKPDGTSQWIKFYLYGPAALSISALSDSDFVAIAGGKSSQTGNYLLKINNLGDTLWTRPYKGYIVKALANNDFLAISGSEPNVDFIMFDDHGNENWKVENTDVSTTSFDQGCSNILDYNSQHFIFSILKNDATLYLYEFDVSGNKTNTIQVKNVSSDTQVALTTTMDNGVIVVKSNISSSTKTLELTKYSKVIP